MHPRPAHLPDFENPPVTEVLLGLQFAPVSGFQAVHLGLLWDRFRDAFPVVEEKPPLNAVFETFGIPAAAPEIRFELLQMPMLTRLWLKEPNDVQLIQFQTDRFIHNWRKVAVGQEYPRYEAIRERFTSEIEAVRTFLADHKLGDITPNQCEVTYVNLIESPENTNLGASLAEVFQIWSAEGQASLRFPTEDAGFTLRSVIRKDEDPIGRLIVSARPVRQPDGPVGIQLELTARGRPLPGTIQGAMEFLDLGRERIVQGFADITTPRMHNLWRRRQ